MKRTSSMRFPRLGELLFLAACLAGLEGARAHSIIVYEGGSFGIPEASSKIIKYRIQHACEGKPITALSFMIPTVNPRVTRLDGGAIPDVDQNGNADLADVIQGGSLVGLIQPLYDTSVFRKRQLKKDSLENSVGLSGSGGRIEEGFFADVPMVAGPVFFVPESCASQLTLHPVGADICKVSKKPRAGEVNIWVEHATPRFSDAGIHGVGENALTIVYQRDVATNPLPEACPETFAVDVYASDEDIDANLPTPRVWPK